MKRCIHCEEFKPYEAFYRNRKAKDGWHLFRRTARKQERDLEHRRTERLAIAERGNSLYDVGRLRRTSFRVAKRYGGFRWCVERIVR
jgi:hypothetical protein